ncbi:MAG: hypothetical protein ACK5M1_12765 [Xanthomarina gelatinilytica]|uniref:hypothetical protein n=1 Tax=Xanthomarina gelatinilytica TaxID=1137281 RepID=UPI003A8B2053
MLGIFKKALLTIGLFFCLTQAIFSQYRDSNKCINRIQDEITSFLIKNEVYSNKSFEEKEASLIITEILKVSPLGYNKIGIYGIGAHVSHSPSFILLKKNNKIRILDPNEINKSFKVLIRFLNKYIDSEADRVNYIFKVSQVFNDNLDNNILETDYKFRWKKME